MGGINGEAGESIKNNKGRYLEKVGEEHKRDTFLYFRTPMVMDCYQ